jgi:sulfatase modifying factor 1
VSLRVRAHALSFPLWFALAGCERRTPPETSPPDAAAPPRVSAATPRPPGPPPALLYLPDGGDRALEGAPPLGLAEPLVAGRCGADMVDVAGRFCIDRYEATLVDTRLARAISPYFAPERSAALRALAAFTDGFPAGAPAMPRPPDFELSELFEPRAVSQANTTPNGYVSGLLARRACENAGKRLCTAGEWVTACRGQQNRQFPYGATYEAGACNVGREAHPAALLWGDASKNHLDPRLNLVEGPGGPLLRRTGETARCRSEWGLDGVLDMVGNLDEWVDEPGGAFLGGFYSRATVNGCEARVTEHPPEYFDYSTGVRCCR